MADPRADVEQVNAALTQIGERAAADPEYRESLRTNQVDELRAAGVSVFALSGAFAEEGAEEDDVAAFGMVMTRPGGGQIIVSNTCLGTCSGMTITVCCTQSFTGGAARGAGGGGTAAAGGGGSARGA